MRRFLLTLVAMWASTHLWADAEIPQGTHVVQTIQTTEDEADLVPLAEMIGTKTIVGLGEATHGSVGFLQTKVRLTRYLVEHLGFRVIAFESGWVDAERHLAQFIESGCRGGTARLERAVQRGIGVFASNETNSLVEWICQFNTEYPNDRIRVVGFDINHYNIPALLDVVRQYFTHDLPESIANCAGVAEGANLFTDIYEPTDYHRCLSGLYDLMSHLSDINPSERRALMALESLKAAQDVAFYFDQKDHRNRRHLSFDANILYSNARDLQMAKNLRHQVDFRREKHKIILWAHDDHIKMPSGPIMTLGSNLAMHSYVPRRGHQYFALGIIAHEIATKSGSSVAPEDGFLESQLARLGLPYLLVDTQKYFSDDRKVKYHFVFGQHSETRAKEEYDGFFFLRSSSPQR